jgi:hypothetical protein
MTVKPGELRRAASSWLNAKTEAFRAREGVQASRIQGYRKSHLVSYHFSGKLKVVFATSGQSRFTACLMHAVPVCYDTWTKYD